MANRFSVEAIFKAVDRFTAPITRMQNRVGKMTRSMTRGLRTANKALGSVVSGLRRGAAASLKFAGVGIGAITGAVTLLIREFSKIENAEAAFTPLLRGAKKAKELVAALNKTAASTPFQFETLSKTATQLLPVMKGKISEIIKVVRMLGDTAGGNAEKLNSITLGFSKAMLKGKVDLESLNIIGEAGVPIFTELAESMGRKVTPAFFKMISSGRITTKQLTAAFTKMTSKGGIFFKGMEIASKTTTGIFSTLQDNISLTAAEIGGILAPTVKDLLKQAIKMSRVVREWVKNNRDLISKKFTDFIKSGKDALLRLIEVIKNLNKENKGFEKFKKAIDVVIDGVLFLGKHGETILKITAAIVGLSVAAKALGAIMTIVNIVMAANPIGLIVIAIAAMTAGIALAITRWDDLKASMLEFKDLFPDIPTTAVSKALRSIPGAAPLAAVFDAMGGGSPQVVSPEERTAKSIQESSTTTKSEVTIKDETGRAALTGGRLGEGIFMQKTGAF